MAENVLTRKFGPLPGWQWVALAGGGAGIVVYLVRARAANKAAAQGDTGGGAFMPSPIPGNGILSPIIIQNGPGSTPTTPGGGGSTAQPAAFLTGAEWKTLSKAHQAQWQPFTTAGGARGFAPKPGVIPFLTVAEYRKIAPANQRRFTAFTTPGGAHGYEPTSLMTAAK